MTSHEWAQALAEVVAPDEVDLAPLWLDAYLKGGQSKADLFATSHGVAGGYSPNEVLAMVPQVFGALAGAGTLVIAVLGSEHVKLVVKSLSACLDIGQLGTRIVGGGKDGDKSRTDDVPEADRVLLERACWTIADELLRRGVRKSDSERVARRVILRLSQQPEHATQFVQTLVKAGGA